jgi:hypothetical protein
MVKGCPGKRVDFALQPAMPRELGGQARQPLAVNLDAVALHLRDHRDQRAIDPLIDRACRFLRTGAASAAATSRSVTSASSAA